ncbi:MAG: metal-dependent transcriptional regulator [Candidatus Riflebacteria bacterium]|nr:metal-dependent transcriptional regulator [Candidatus Riflebacteria bacterium]
MLTEKEEEILEAMWKSEEEKNFSIESIKKFCVTEFSDVDMNKLETNGFIGRKSDQLLFSTEGRIAAEGIIRRHRLAEVLVTSILKLKQTEMEEIACKVEHCLLPEVEEAICTLLGHPDICPDGRTIPPGKCCQEGIRSVGRVVLALFELEPGESGKLTYIKPENQTIFQQLLAIGLRPGVLVTVLRKFPAFCVRFENTELALDDNIAQNIFVWRLNHSDTGETLM